MRNRHLFGLIAVPVLLVVPAAAAVATSGQYSANLRPVAHDPSADGGSNVTGKAQLQLHGRNLTVDLRATGLTPGEPHAMHIHGDVANNNECPPASADTSTGDPIDPATYTEGTPDGLISLGEGAPFYGPIDVSFTTTGDTSPSSGLTLERMPVANAAGVISYHRTIKVPQSVAMNMTNLHIVLHGADLPTDADQSSLSSLFEATLPVACGQIQQ